MLRCRPLGHANTSRGVQGRRPTLYVHEKRLAALPVPVLVVVGDEDALLPQAEANSSSASFRRARPRLPRRPGTCVELENPEEFNRLCLEFLGEGGRREPLVGSVATEIRGAVAIVTLDNAARRNAIDAKGRFGARRRGGGSEEAQGRRRAGAARRR